MRITDILTSNSIVTDLLVKDKSELLNVMIDLAVQTGRVKNRDEVKSEILQRESIMSTGIGKEIALPHAKSNAITDTVAALAILKNPVDYGSLDGDPVSIVFLLVGLENNVGIHLRLLSKISRLLSKDDFRDELKSCKTVDQVIQLFNNNDNND